MVLSPVIKTTFASIPVHKLTTGKTLGLAISKHIRPSSVSFGRPSVARKGSPTPNELYRVRYIKKVSSAVFILKHSSTVVFCTECVYLSSHSLLTISTVILGPAAPTGTILNTVVLRYLPAITIPTTHTIHNINLLLRKNKGSIF